MAKLHERINFALNCCRIFSVGFQFNNSKIALVVDILSLSLNLSISVYGYCYVISFIQKRMTNLWDITTVMSVIKVYTYLLTPPIMIIMIQLHKKNLTNFIYKFDEIIPSVKNASLRPFLRYSVILLSLSIIFEVMSYSLFHMSTNFQFFSMFDYLLIFIYNFWSVVPLLQYIFFIRIIHHGIENINNQITSISVWRECRDHWKELRFIAVHVAKHEYGVIIVVFVTHTITEIVFDLFALYFLGYKRSDDISLYYLVITINTLNALFSAFMMFEIFRISQNCKFEVLYN